MKSLTQREFEKRWNAAASSTASRKIKTVKKPEIKISLNSILDNYMKRVQEAVNSHAIESCDADELCRQINQLKPLIEKVQSKAKPYLTL